MLDPIGGFERIRDLYVAYLDTAFRVRRQSLLKRRRELLRTPGTLTTLPLIEPVPRYLTSEKALEDLVEDSPDNPIRGLTRSAKVAFAELALSGLFPGLPAQGELTRKHRFKPYRHQMTMLERGIGAGTPGIVTSGTGSGKTEAFMLPILAALAGPRPTPSRHTRTRARPASYTGIIGQTSVRRGDCENRDCGHLRELRGMGLT